MNFTVFNTPVIKQIFQLTAIIILKFKGWKFVKNKNFAPKAVVIAAPHTSNWDFFYTILMAFKINLKVSWLGKDSLFKGPGGWFLKWLGGIPVDRSKSNNLVKTIAGKFEKADKVTIIIPPEGTRSKVNAWKTGFYYVALEAGVPILMGFLDFKLKIGGIGPAFEPSGDIQKDMEIIKGFYRNITGKYPEKTGLPDIEPSKVKLACYDELVDNKSFLVTPTGNLERDIIMIQSYYASMVNKVKPGTFV
jgi:1-acyl-sn-glycerol-3-phosphate acyltransferase